MHEDYGRELGERVLSEALAFAQQYWRNRLVAAYALGSLAHRGFSAHVSDVDFGILLADPLRENDACGIAALSDSVQRSGAPLADRLSVFWGTVSTCSGAAPGGRFPPVDRLDLIESGRLLAGTDIRAAIPKPAVRDMVLEAAETSAKSMSRPEVIAELRQPARLAEAGVRPLTKRVLFPVRYLFTARTGRIGATDLAVEDFARRETGPAAELAVKALEWRYAPFDRGDPKVVPLLEAGLLPLHRLYFCDYAARLRDYGATEIETAFSELRRLYGLD